MGLVAVDPSRLTASGDRALRRISRVSVETPATPQPWVLVSCVAVVEAHVSTILRRLVAATSIDATLFGAELLAASRDDIFKTWDARMTWLSRAFQVRLAGSTPFQRFKVLVELRNALLHGDGELTELQVRSVTKALALKRQLKDVLNVECVGRRVVLGHDSYRRGSTACRAFVAALDADVLRLYPDLSTDQH